MNTKTQPGAGTRTNWKAEAAKAGCTLERVGRSYRVLPPPGLVCDPFADDHYADGPMQLRTMLNAYARLVAESSSAEMPR